MRKTVLYVRNYNQGIDLSWQEVFQTDNKKEVESFCKNHDIEYKWNNQGPELTTRQICQASIIHPISKAPSWFNQAHLFHASALTESEKMTLIETIGYEDYLPRNTFYGNGEPIELEVLEHIKEAYNKEKIKFQWHKGDLMVLDNLLTAHSREPYKGERKVVVAMA